jgi:hypothetical protein
MSNIKDLEAELDRAAAAMEGGLPGEAFGQAAQQLAQVRGLVPAKTAQEEQSEDLAELERLEAEDARDGSPSLNVRRRIEALPDTDPFAEVKSAINRSIKLNSRANMQNIAIAEQEEEAQLAALEQEQVLATDAAQRAQQRARGFQVEQRRLIGDIDASIQALEEQQLTPTNWLSSGRGVVGAILLAVAGGVGGATRQPQLLNQAMSVINGAIDRERRAQLDNLRRQQAVIGNKFRTLGLAKELFESDEAAAQFQDAAALASVRTQLKRAAAGLTGERARAAALALDSRLQQEMVGRRLSIAQAEATFNERRRAERVQRRDEIAAREEFRGQFENFGLRMKNAVPKGEGAKGKLLDRARDKTKSDVAVNLVDELINAVANVRPEDLGSVASDVNRMISDFGINVEAFAEPVSVQRLNQLVEEAIVPIRHAMGQTDALNFNERAPAMAALTNLTRANISVKDKVVNLRRLRQDIQDAMETRFRGDFELLWAGRPSE